MNERWRGLSKLRQLHLSPLESVKLLRMGGEVAGFPVIRRSVEGVEDNLKAFSASSVQFHKSFKYGCIRT